MHLIATATSQPAPALVLYALVIAASTLSLGGLLEGRRLGARIEQARGAALGLAFALLPDWFGYEARCCCVQRYWCCRWAPLYGWTKT
jgi:hypothetical protein